MLLLTFCNIGKFPILARMARDILAVPASTVASESAFSSGEEIINDYRSIDLSPRLDQGEGEWYVTHDEIANPFQLFQLFA
jgi:hypothetical protein